MPIRFYRRVRIAPGLTINLSKSGPSVSVGRRGAHVTVGRRGVRESVGIPGTGLGAYHQESWSHGGHRHADPTHHAPDTDMATTAPSVAVAAPPRGAAWMGTVHAVAFLVVVGSILAYAGAAEHDVAVFGSGLGVLWAGVYLEAVKHWGWGHTTLMTVSALTAVALLAILVVGVLALVGVVIIVACMGSSLRSSKRR